jgi:succinyl-diaminopimelate desuccinylase
MSKLLIEKIDALIESSRKEVADLTKEFVNIKSVQEPSIPGAPFGAGVKKVLDKAIEVGKEDGFYTNNYNVGVVSLAMKDTPIDLGIWIHGDVVPEGGGWEFEPYNATEYEGRIIGRGAADNKGQFAAIFVLFKIFKELGIDLNYNPAIFVGSNEETGKKDLLGIEGNDDAKGFLNVYTPPKLSLVPDGAFPVGYGGKGNVNLTLKTKDKLENITLTAGQSPYPGKATVCFLGKDIDFDFKDCTVTKDGNTTVESFSQPVHTAHPDPNGNMITILSNALLESNILKEKEKRVFEFLKKISSDTEGAMFGINVETKTMKPLTLATPRISFIDGYAEVFVNIRNPIEITPEEIQKNITKVADEYGFELSSFINTQDPYLLNKDSELVKTLCTISNSVTGDNKEPYTVGGGTYAHKLPNAYVFGSSSNFPPESWEKGRGGAHGIDEAVSLDRLQRCMKIYARALLELNDIEW